ncbi:MAG: hypothetical protein ACPLQO_02335 [Desulfotomaculales bacterium]
MRKVKLQSMKKPYCTCGGKLVEVKAEEKIIIERDETGLTRYVPEVGRRTTGRRDRR